MENAIVDVTSSDEDNVPQEKIIHVSPDVSDDQFYQHPDHEFGADITDSDANTKVQPTGSLSDAEKKAVPQAFKLSTQKAKGFTVTTWVRGDVKIHDKYVHIAEEHHKHLLLRSMPTNKLPEDDPLTLMSKHTNRIFERVQDLAAEKSGQKSLQFSHEELVESVQDEDEDEQTVPEGSQYDKDVKKILPEGGIAGEFEVPNWLVKKYGLGVGTRFSVPNGFFEITGRTFHQKANLWRIKCKHSALTDNVQEGDVQTEVKGEPEFLDTLAQKSKQKDTEIEDLENDLNDFSDQMAMQQTIEGHLDQVQQELQAHFAKHGHLQSVSTNEALNNLGSELSGATKQLFETQRSELIKATQNSIDESNGYEQDLQDDDEFAGNSMDQEGQDELDLDKLDLMDSEMDKSDDDEEVDDTDMIWSYIKKAANWVANKARKAAASLRRVCNSIVAIVRKGGFSALVASFGNMMKKLGAHLVKGFKFIGNRVVSTIKTYARKIGNAVAGFARSVGNAVAKFASGIVKGLKAVGKGLIKFVKNKVVKFVKKATAAIVSAVNKVKSVVNFIKNAVSGKVDMRKAFGPKLSKTFKNRFIINQRSKYGQMKVGLKEATARVIPNFVLAIKVRKFKLKRFSAVLSGNMRLSMLMLAQLTGQFEKNKERQLGKTKSKTVRFSIGPIPVWIKIKGWVFAGTTVEVNAGIMVKFGGVLSTGIKVGLVYQGGRFRALFKKHFHKQLNLPKGVEPCAQLLGEVYLRPKIAFLFYGVAGPTFELEPFLQMTFRPSGMGNCEAYGKNGKKKGKRGKKRRKNRRGGRRRRVQDEIQDDVESEIEDADQRRRRKKGKKNKKKKKKKKKRKAKWTKGLEWQLTLGLRGRVGARVELMGKALLDKSFDLFEKSKVVARGTFRPFGNVQDSTIAQNEEEVSSIEDNDVDQGFNPKRAQTTLRHIVEHMARYKASRTWSHRQKENSCKHYWYLFMKTLDSSARHALKIRCWPNHNWWYRWGCIEQQAPIWIVVRPTWYRVRALFKNLNSHYSRVYAIHCWRKSSWPLRVQCLMHYYQEMGIARTKWYQMQAKVPAAYRHISWRQKTWVLRAKVLKKYFVSYYVRKKLFMTIYYKIRNLVGQTVASHYYRHAFRNNTWKGRLALISHSLKRVKISLGHQQYRRVRTLAHRQDRSGQLWRQMWRPCARLPWFAAGKCIAKIWSQFHGLSSRNASTVRRAARRQVYAFLKSVELRKVRRLAIQAKQARNMVLRAQVRLAKTRGLPNSVRRAHAHKIALALRSTSKVLDQDIAMNNKIRQLCRKAAINASRYLTKRLSAHQRRHEESRYRAAAARASRSVQAQKRKLEAQRRAAALKSRQDARYIRKANRLFARIHEMTARATAMTYCNKWYSKKAKQMYLCAHAKSTKFLRQHNMYTNKTTAMYAKITNPDHRRSVENRCQSRRLKAAAEYKCAWTGYTQWKKSIRHFLKAANWHFALIRNKGLQNSARRQCSKKRHARLIYYCAKAASTRYHNSIKIAAARRRALQQAKQRAIIRAAKRAMQAANARKMKNLAKNRAALRRKRQRAKISLNLRYKTAFKSTLNKLRGAFFHQGRRCARINNLRQRYSCALQVLKRYRHHLRTKNKRRGHPKRRHTRRQKRRNLHNTNRIVVKFCAKFKRNQQRKCRLQLMARLKSKISYCHSNTRLSRWQKQTAMLVRTSRWNMETFTQWLCAGVTWL